MIPAQAANLRKPIATEAGSTHHFDGDHDGIGCES